MVVVGLNQGFACGVHLSIVEVVTTGIRFTSPSIINICIPIFHLKDKKFKKFKFWTVCANGIRQQIKLWLEKFKFCNVCTNGIKFLLHYLYLENGSVAAQ